VKKHGSFPSVTLYSGTCGDNPSREVATSIYFWKEQKKEERNIPTLEYIIKGGK
jgi:hypothetical protein